jgi:DNA-binding winged helix-turn-helix (wHTH) protein
MIEFPPYRLDQRTGRLWRGSQAVPLRPKAWALLCYLAARPGALVTKEEMHAGVWGEAVVSDDTLTHTLAELRQALSDDPRAPRFIETVHRRGVRFIARLCEPQAEGSATSAPDGPDVPGDDEPSILVGREADVARLGALLREASAGRRQVVFVQGEAGIGKSAIVEAFLRTARAAPDPVLIGFGQCVEQHAEREPYMPVLEALERLGRGSSRDRVLSALRSVAPSWLARMPLLQRPADAERLRRWHVDTTPHRMLRELTGLVEAISIDQPLVLVLEDLHWSDRATVDLLSVLAQRPDRARTMLVGTSRPAEAAALQHPIQRVLTLLRARDRCVEIAVEYLTRDDLAAYLLRRFPGSRVDDELVHVMHAHTNGNPLFMTVLVNHLLARGWLAREGQLWRLTVPPAMIEREVPDNTRQLIEGQLRFVSPAELDVLEVASVAGVTFDLPGVTAAVGAGTGLTETICHGLCGAQRWLRHLGSREWPDGSLAERYGFRHALYQRTLYDRISPGRRAALHEQIGRRLEEGYAGRTAEASSELARHFEAGRDHRRALRYLEEAATQAYERRAYRDVLACLEPGLALLRQLPDTPERDRDEIRLRGLYTIVLSQTAGPTPDALVENLRRTEALAERLDDPATLFDALAALSLERSTAGDLRAAEALYARLLEISGRLGASASLQYHFLRGAAALWAGNLSVAEPLLAGALSSPVSLEEADRPYGVNPVVAARSFEGLRRWLRGDPAGAREVQGEAEILAERQGRPFTIAQAATFRAVVSALEDDWGEVARLTTRVIEISEEYGFPRWRARALIVRGRARAEAGDATRGFAEIGGGLEVLRQTGRWLGASLFLSFQAGACLRLERPAEGLVAVDAGLAHTRGTGERAFEAELWRLRGELLLRETGSQQGRISMAEAEECFARARAVASAQGAPMLERRASRRDGRVADARRVPLSQGLVSSPES